MTRQPSRTLTLADYWGSRVKDHRKAAGRTQKTLAALAGVEQQTISAIEHGRIIPADRLKLRLARVLGTTPGELFEWPDDLDEAAA